MDLPKKLKVAEHLNREDVMEEMETKKIVVQVQEKRSNTLSDYVLPIWALIYLILMFILFCKGVVMVINCGGCGGTETQLLSLFG
jgi:hypothetical protein